MSLQWSLVAGFLYIEIAIVALLVLPVLTARRWQKFFNSRILLALKSQAGIYFVVLLGILVLFCLDAVREMRKYSAHDHHKDNHLVLDMGLQDQMRLFRAQRNFYISGFALFLAFVIRRLCILISTQASLENQAEASMKQAQGASAAAKSMVSKLADRSEENEISENKAHVVQVAALKDCIKDLEKALAKEKKDKEAIKSQGDNLIREYDRLSDEHSRLMKKITAGGEKKDE